MKEMKVSNDANSGPVLFNAIKHHRGHIQAFIREAISNNYTAEEIRVSLLKVGRLMIDLYLGDLDVPQIEKEILGILKNKNIFDQKRYVEFIDASNKNFRTVSLSDGSNWTLLSGREKGRYIHIHPSRYAKHTVRVRAMALKTAIYLNIFYQRPITDEQLTAVTNEVRSKYLHESPIKNEVYTTGLKRVLKLL